MSRTKSIYSLRGAVESALKFAKMKDCSFESIHLKPEFPLPKREADVDKFIKGRTDLWRESYLIPALERALSKIKARDVKSKTGVAVSGARQTAQSKTSESGLS